MKILFADNLKQLFYSGEGDDIIVKSKIKDGIIDFPQLRKLSLKLKLFWSKGFCCPIAFFAMSKHLWPRRMG
jgi:hypothetical protein